MPYPNNIYSEIIGTGCHIPRIVVKNDDFAKRVFYYPDGTRFEKPTEQIIKEFEAITGIKERRYAGETESISDTAYDSAAKAIEMGGIDQESLDYIIVGHNLGNLKQDLRQTDQVPTIAARVKHLLKIKNPKTIAYDLPFGCPGFLQGMIQGNYYIKSGDAKRILIIGTEMLSRISDPYDRDSMIFSDGAGAVLLQAHESDIPVGIISHAVRSDTYNEAYFLYMGTSNNPLYRNDQLFLKMHGHKVYEYALRYVPLVVKESIEKAGLHLFDIKKFLLHQANEKLDFAIVNRLYKVYKIKEVDIHDIPPSNRAHLKRLYGEKEKYDIHDLAHVVMPATVAWLGNSSVATLPTLLDLIVRKNLDHHALEKGDTVVFASVGAGMNINSVVYKIPFDSKLI